MDAYFIGWFRSVFIWRKDATIPIYYFMTIKKELNEKKCEKEFILYLNVVSKYLSFNI